MEYFLHILEGPDKGKKFAIMGEVTLIGRSEQCHVHLNDNAISRHHIQLTKSPATLSDRFVLKDLDSVNGTEVNGRKLNAGTITPSDRITIGETTLAIKKIKENISFSMETIAEKLVIEPGEEDEQLVASRSISESVSLPDKVEIESVDRLKRRLTALYELGSTITMSGTLFGKLDKFIDCIFSVIPAEMGCVLLHDPKNDNLVPLVLKHVSFDENSPLKVKISRTIVDNSIRDKAGILATDAADDPRFKDATSVIRSGMRSVICVPLYFQDTLQGVIFLSTSLQTGLFSEEDLEFVTSIAHEAAGVIQNQQLVDDRIKKAKLVEVGEIIAGLTHYMKNVLFSHNTSRDMINKALSEGDLETVGSLWKIVQKSNDKIAELVDNMVYFSTEKKMGRDKVDVHEIIRDVTRHFEKDLREKRITLNVDFDDELPSCVTSKDALHRVFHNVLKNALDAVSSEGQGAITILTKRMPLQQIMEISFTDNGEGIPPQDLERIFHYLYTTKGAGGTGLGLYICRHILNQIGGQISVKSSRGAGSTFNVQLSCPDSL